MYMYMHITEYKVLQLSEPSFLWHQPHTVIDPQHNSTPRRAYAAAMVCTKCAKLATGTKLATPGVKRKSDMYYGSPASTSAGAEKKSATLGQSGVGKVCILVYLYTEYRRIYAVVCLC